MQASRWWPVLAVLLLPNAAAHHQGPDDLNPLHLNVAVYHPYPDEQGDPWGFQQGQVNGTGVDWMRATYGAFWYPTAVVDGVVQIDEGTQGEGGGAFNETMTAYEGAYLGRVERDAPVRIQVEGEAVERELRVNVTVQAKGSLPSDDLLLRLVFVEDDVIYNGGSGIVHHRFVVRDEHHVPNARIGSGGFSVEHAFHMTEVVEPDNAGVVVVLQNFDEDSPVFAWKEVLQSTTWLVRQQGPTVQDARGVLLELYSATWCRACVVGDAVADQLANKYGVLSSRAQDTGFEYLRPGDWWKLGVAAIGAIGFTYWVRRQRPPEAPQ